MVLISGVCTLVCTLVLNFSTDTSHSAPSMSHPAQNVLKRRLLPLPVSIPSLVISWHIPVDATLDVGCRSVLICQHLGHTRDLILGWHNQGDHAGTISDEQYWTDKIRQINDTPCTTSKKKAELTTLIFSDAVISTRDDPLLQMFYSAPTPVIISAYM